MLRDITYFLTRDTNASGELSLVIDVWWRRPIRHRVTHRSGNVWLPSRSPDARPSDGTADIGYLGAYSVDQVKQWFKTVPDTDMECIRCDTRVEDRIP